MCSRINLLATFLWVGYLAVLMTEAKIDNRIAAIKKELAALGPLHPGSISRQYNVCGGASCRCKIDPAQRHGPYYQLSYAHRRKSTSTFVREGDLAEVEQQLRNYERLRALVEEWIDLSTERGRLLRALRKQQSTGKIRGPKQLSFENRPRSSEKKSGIMMPQTLVPQGQQSFRDRN